MQGDIKTKITQIYTNRATSFHMVNEQDRCEADCTYVLTWLDEKNQKALFRRAHALKLRGEYAEAAQDLENLIKYSENGKDFQSDLQFCLDKVKETDQQRKAENQEQEKQLTMKIQPVPAQANSQTQIEEGDSDANKKLFIDPKKFIEDAKEWGQKIRKHRQRAQKKNQRQAINDAT